MEEDIQNYSPTVIFLRHPVVVFIPGHAGVLNWCIKYWSFTILEYFIFFILWSTLNPPLHNTQEKNDAQICIKYLLHSLHTDLIYFYHFPYKQLSVRGGGRSWTSGRVGRKTYINMILTEILLSLIKLVQQQTSSYLTKIIKKSNVCMKTYPIYNTTKMYRLSQKTWEFSDEFNIVFVIN